MSDEPLMAAGLIRGYAATVERLELVLKRRSTDLQFCEARMLRYEQELAEASALLRRWLQPMNRSDFEHLEAQTHELLEAVRSIAGPTPRDGGEEP